MNELSQLLQDALARRQEWIAPPYQAAFRLFNGFYEGEPNLLIDIYARTAVLHNYADRPLDGAPLIRQASDFIRETLPWVQAILVKVRRGTPEERRGVLIYGGQPDRRIREHGVRYAIDLTLNRDTSFYLDTRNLRRWALENLRGKTVLNTFAYTGSIGVAALAGGASRVVQTDRSRNFLNLAKESCTLNGLTIVKKDYLVGDFFPITARLRRARALFDCVFLDPPFFSTSAKGRVEWENNPKRLLNKVRPLVAPGGWLVSVNNALFLSGQAYLNVLESVCAGGHFQLETILPVDADFAIPPDARRGAPPADPHPFNHPTKIAILRRLS